MLPKSATNMYYNMTGLLGFCFTLFILRSYAFSFPLLTECLILLAGTALPMFFCEVVLEKCYENPTSGVNFFKRNSLNIPRVFTKLIGLYALWIGIAFIYFIFPEYRGNFYKIYYDLLTICFPFVAILSVPYFFILDPYLREPEDAYYHLGRVLLRKERLSNSDLQLFLGWLVKAFFLPLMFIYFTEDTKFLNSFNIQNVFSNFKNFFDFTYQMLFTLDVLWVCIGYACTLKIFDTHIRSTEGTLLGWSCALFCYQPFWSFFSANYLDYTRDTKHWGDWMSGSPWLYIVWGSCILILLGIYLWATFAFGPRFSNLTHRGIITNGPYRYTKHPAYLCKNLAWWFMSMPFMVTTTYIDSFRHCCMLLMLNLVYFLRAKTEERHLCKDPVYCQYKDYIAENGLFAFKRKQSEEYVPSIV